MIPWDIIGFLVLAVAIAVPAGLFVLYLVARLAGRHREDCPSCCQRRLRRVRTVRARGHIDVLELLSMRGVWRTLQAAPAGQAARTWMGYSIIGGVGHVLCARLSEESPPPTGRRRFA